MKKNWFFILSLAASLLSTACDRANDTASGANHNLKIACTETMETLLKPALPWLAAQGVNAELIIVDNNMSVLKAINDGSVDAGLGVHIKFMTHFNKQNAGHLAMLEPYPFTTGIGLYSERFNRIEDLPYGAKIAIMNDAMNMDRALRILQEAKLIKLNRAKSSGFTLLDILENPKNILFIDMDQIQTVWALQDVDAALIFFTHMRNANKDFRSYLIRDNDAVEFPMGMVVLKSNVDHPWAQTLAEALHTEPVKQGIVENFDGVFEYCALSQCG